MKPAKSLLIGAGLGLVIITLNQMGLLAPFKSPPSILATPGAKEVTS